MKGFTMKSVLYGVALVVAVGGVTLLALGGNGGEEVLIVATSDFVQEISVSGKVIPARSVDLVFSDSGRVAGVYTDVGKTVALGAVLASLENGDAQADVLQKEAAFEAAQAQLQSLKNGTRFEQIAVTESKVSSAEAALLRANQTLVDALTNAYTESDDAIRHRVDELITGAQSAQPLFNYTLLDQSLKSDIEAGRLIAERMLVSWGADIQTLSSVTDLPSFVERANKNLAQTQALLQDVVSALNSLTARTSLPQATLDDYRTSIATARSNVHSAITTLTSALTAQKNAEGALATVRKDLVLEQAGATTEDIAQEEANLKAAEAALLSAQARLRKTLIVAPFSGVITRMEAKVGGSASPSESVISIIGADTLQVESFVPEIHLPLIEVGDEAIATLDAFGEEVKFPLRILAIDPAETIRDGVSTYRVKLRFAQKDLRIVSGMNANIVITTEKRANVIAIPQGLLIKREGKTFVPVRGKDGTEEREVETGSVSSLGSVEILSGLSEGDEVLLSPTK
ncbi:MAG: efflux RND transporter periplasmic adaptor subunit [bacterium]|nr:efflux RND transporter periplasmic adaptor subunit [bacterium]